MNRLQEEANVRREFEKIRAQWERSGKNDPNFAALISEIFFSLAERVNEMETFDVNEPKNHISPIFFFQKVKLSYKKKIESTQPLSCGLVSSLISSSGVLY